MITKLIKAKPNPQNQSIQIVLEDEKNKRFEFFLVSEVVHHLLSAFLSKKILHGYYEGTEAYPISLAAVSPVALEDGQAVLRLFFPSGFPVTVEFIEREKDIDKLIAALQTLKTMLAYKPSSTH